jgi:hypothetical protein
MEYASRAGDDRETREQARWVLETAGANMTPKEMAKFVQVFSGPRRLGRDRFGGRMERTTISGEPDRRAVATAMKERFSKRTKMISISR